jgi:hypothetical protein
MILGIFLSPSILLLIFLLSIILIFLFKRKRKINTRDIQSIQTSDNQHHTSPALIIPEDCPHCKNPNTKRIRLCEWCGNQII